MTPTVLSQLPRVATVVVIRLRSLGDTVLTTPALALLKQARPDLRIVVVLEPVYRELLDGNPDVSRVLTPDRTRRLWRLRMARAIRAEQPALCLNLHGGSTSAWWTVFSGARFRAGFDHFSMQFAYNVRIPRAQTILRRDAEETVHTAEHHASAMFHLGVPVAEVPRAVLHADGPVADQDAPAENETIDTECGDTVCGDTLPGEKPYAVFHVTAAYFTKQWPAEQFRETAEFVRDQYGLEPVIIAGPGEEAIFERFSGFRCAGGLPLGELKSLLAGAGLFVGNDSGPAHMAAAFGVPTVVVFGSSNSTVWRPWKTPGAVVETPWDCKPCPGDRCYAFDEPRCILSVKASEVEAAIRGLLSDDTSDRRSQLPA